MEAGRHKPAMRDTLQNYLQHTVHFVGFTFISLRP